jgi:alkylhydroperoxidase family enzyme
MSARDGNTEAERLLADFPDIPAVRGREPVQLINAVSIAGPPASKLLQFAKSIMTEGRLAPAVRELVILRVAWVLSCSYVWGGHALIAEEVELRFPAPREGWPPEHAAALALADELLAEHASDRSRAWATDVLGADGLVEVALLVGLYSLISTVVLATGLEREPGTPPLPAVWPGAEQERP